MQRSIIALLLLASGSVCAFNPFDAGRWSGPAPEEEPRQPETEAALPPWPRDAELLEFSVAGAPARHRYAIDPHSLAVGDDGALRYTAVIDAGSARNLFFDGMRCATARYKNYAFGVRDQFVRNEEAEWQPLRSFGIHRFRHTLYQEVICDGFGNPRPLERIVSDLKYRASGSRQER